MNIINYQHMKRIFSIVFFVTLTMMSWAQRVNPFDQLKADPKRAYGTDFPYSFDAPALTKAPKVTSRSISATILVMVPAIT